MSYLLSAGHASISDMNNAWAAGFFDGEGNVGIRERWRNGSVAFTLYIAVTQNDVRPLAMLKKSFGGWLGQIRSNPRCHRWVASGVAAERFLEAVLPHLVVKRKKAEIGLRLRRWTGTRGVRTGGKRVKIRQRLKRSLMK